MPHDRFFSKELLTEKSVITLEKTEAAHIHVMRKKVGDIIEIINGKNILSHAQILSISPKETVVEIIDIVKEKPTQTKIILVQSFVKSSKLDLILEKATELGVDEFILFKADQSEIVKFSDEKEKRFHSLLISAVKQCGRLDLPKITFIPNLYNLKQNSCSYFFGDPDSSTLFSARQYRNHNTCFIIGPEKGFSNKEILFLKTKLKALGVKINKNILRTETAAICVAALLAHKKYSS